MYVRRLGPSTILYQRTAKDTLRGCRNPHGGGQRPELLAVSQYLEVRIASFKCGATGHVVVRLNNNLLTLMGHLHRSAEPRDPLLFETEAWRLLNEFQKETADADRTIQEISARAPGMPRGWQAFGACSGV